MNKVGLTGLAVLVLASCTPNSQPIALSEARKAGLRDPQVQRYWSEKDDSQSCATFPGDHYEIAGKSGNGRESTLRIYCPKSDNGDWTVKCRVFNGPQILDSLYQPKP